MAAKPRRLAKTKTAPRRRKAKIKGLTKKRPPAKPAPKIGEVLTISRHNVPFLVDEPYRGADRNIPLPDGDVFALYASQPKKGMAYQWLAIPAADQPLPMDRVVLSAGWRHVPFRRHNKLIPKRHRVMGAIVVDGLLLVERTEELHQDARRAGHRAAQNMIRQFYEALGIPEPADRRGWSGEGNATILSSAIITSSAYQRVPADAPDAYATVPIVIRVPASWQDAASALGISEAEYARRKVILLSHGDIAGLLLPLPGVSPDRRDCAPFEIREIVLSEAGRPFRS